MNNTPEAHYLALLLLKEVAGAVPPLSKRAIARIGHSYNIAFNVPKTGTPPVTPEHCAFFKYEQAYEIARQMIESAGGKLIRSVLVAVGQKKQQYNFIFYYSL